MATAVSQRRSLVRLGLPDKLFPALILFFMVLGLLIYPMVTKVPFVVQPAPATSCATFAMSRAHLEKVGHQ